jgi:hypothetical protein
MQKANVTHRETKTDKLVRMRGLPCVRRSRSLYVGRVVGGAVLLSMEEKSDEGAKK